MKLRILTGLVAMGLLLHALTGTASAAFNPNKLMADQVFDSYNSMTAAQIDTVLNNQASSCISTKSGFSSILPTGYNPSTGFAYGGYASAGSVIAAAAKAYQINPQVLLVTLQKEQSLVTGSSSFCNDGDKKYAAATGYGCPDSGGTYSYTGVNLYRRNGVTRTSISGTCVNSKAKVGFSQQVVRAAWLLKFGQQRSKGNVDWAIISGSWDNSDDPQSCYSGPMTTGTWRVCPSGSATYYDGYKTIDGVAVHMDTGATAALYWYTPHFHGNQNFVSIFESWFGSTQTTTPYAWYIKSSEAFTDIGRTQKFTSTTTVPPGAKIYIRLKAQNMGNQTWIPSVVRIGTNSPRDRTSQFYDPSWVSASRPTTATESSVKPTETGTFDFTLTAPLTTGSYKERFNLVADGRTWLNDPGLSYTINVVSQTAPSPRNHDSLDPGEMITSGEYLLSSDSQSTLVLQNDGNLVFYRNFKPVWYTGPKKKAARLIMQGDGNLVLYSSAGQPLWHSQTHNHPGATLTLGSNGAFSILDTTGTALWSSNAPHIPNLLGYVNTSLKNAYLLPGQRLETANRKYHLTLQTDGNAVVYAGSRALWQSGTAGKPSARLFMQSDGNLVIYDSVNRPIWNTRTHKNVGAKLIMQSDGNLVIYRHDGRALWWIR